MGIKTLSLELSLCYEQTGPDDVVDRGLFTDSDDEEEADEGLMEAFSMVCDGGF